jgi:hypothetical protein
MRAILPVLLLALAGCLGASNPVGDDASTLQPLSLPPGCDASRVAVAHRAGGVPVAAPAKVPLGCFVHTGVDSAEPTIGIASDGTVFHYPAAVIDRDLPGAAAVRFLTGVAASYNEGADWRILLPTAGPTVPTHQVSLDPYFYLYPATDRIFADDLISPNCSVLSFSDDLGQTWTNSIGGCVVTDHQTLFAGPPVTSTTVGYPNILYRCAINLVALDGASTASSCAKSLDGGLTNVPTGAPLFLTEPGELPNVCGGGVGHGTAGPDGSIYVPKGTCPEAELAISRDEGLTWTRVVVSDLGMADGEHDAGVGVDMAGNLHYFWIGADRLPYLAVSTDRGLTWGPARMVGPPGLVEAHLPALQAGGAGKSAWAYYGSFDSPGDGGDEATTWHQLIGITLDALADDPVYLTAIANDPTDPVARGVCGTVRCNNAVKDFIHLQIGPDGTPWVALVDGCLRACATGDAPANDGRDGAVARLWGLSLWDPSDPNGRYP